MFTYFTPRKRCSHRRELYGRDFFTALARLQRSFFFTIDPTDGVRHVVLSAESPPPPPPPVDGYESEMKRIFSIARFSFAVSALGVCGCLLGSFLIIYTTLSWLRSIGAVDSFSTSKHDTDRSIDAVDSFAALHYHSAR
jgi:hypothetical protein